MEGCSLYRDTERCTIYLLLFLCLGQVAHTQLLALLGREHLSFSVAFTLFSRGLYAKDWADGTTRVGLFLSSEELFMDSCWYEAWSRADRVCHSLMTLQPGPIIPLPLIILLLWKTSSLLSLELGLSFTKAQWNISSYYPEHWEVKIVVPTGVDRIHKTDKR